MNNQGQAAGQPNEDYLDKGKQEIVPMMCVRHVEVNQEPVIGLDAAEKKFGQGTLLSSPA